MLKSNCSDSLLKSRLTILAGAYGETSLTAAKKNYLPIKVAARSAA
jgi:hypothetical protein